MERSSRALRPHQSVRLLDETVFLTKSGDLGMVLSVTGVDYESLDYAEQEYDVKRLEAALKSFGPSFRTDSLTLLNSAVVVLSVTLALS